MVKRDLPGYAIGGLSGGEEKDQFWRMVTLSTDPLPTDKPRYCMGVGYAIDLVVCTALGVDMYDCVFPTRTGRFGNALTPHGTVALRQLRYADDPLPIDPTCTCITCQNYSRAYLHRIAGKESVGCNLVSIHNLNYQMTLMRTMRESIIADQFPDFVRQFLVDLHPDGNVPAWAVNALRSVGIEVVPEWFTETD